MPDLRLFDPQQGIHFDEPSHRYWLWSARLNRWLQPASTTQVLNDADAKGFESDRWKASLIRQGMTPHEADVYMELHRNHRADVGTELHGLIRAELLGLNFHPRHAESLLLLAVWRREVLPQISTVLACEASLASRALFFTGTPDLLAVIGDRLLVLDWKSKVSRAKAKPDPSWPLQLGGYALLIKDVYGLTVDGAMNVMVTPEGMVEVRQNAADMAKWKAAFIGCLAWSHAVRAQEGSADHQLALGHLLRLHPDAMARREPPAGLRLPTAA